MTSAQYLEVGHGDRMALGCAACERDCPVTQATENRLPSTMKASLSLGALVWLLSRNGLHRSTVRHQEVDWTTSNTRSGQEGNMWNAGKMSKAQE
jgi:hypothetical protein